MVVLTGVVRTWFHAVFVLFQLLLLFFAVVMLSVFLMTWLSGVFGLFQPLLFFVAAMVTMTSEQVSDA